MIGTTSCKLKQTNKQKIYTHTKLWTGQKVGLYFHSSTEEEVDKKK